MSMLSEPRRRQKWTLNPRGNLWAQDETKFGQKLMEKMGWEKGRGLGASGQGNVDIITLKHKDDSKGIGFKGHDDTWIAHQDGFSSVLAALNAAHGPEDEAEVDIEIKENSTEEKKSLETTSKSRKRRVHYHKFTRGKDLSRYSTTDLECILGSQAVDLKRKKAAEAPDEEDEEESSMTPMIGFQQNGSDQEKTEDITQKEHGLVTIKRGSMNAYFAEKMAALKAKRNGSHMETDTCEKVETDETDEKIVSKKIKTTRESLLETSEEKDATIITELEIDTETTETTEIKKAKKSKKSKAEKAEKAEMADEQPCKENGDESGKEVKGEVTDEEPEKRKSKKKDKKAKKEIKEEDQEPGTLASKKKSKKSKNKEKLPNDENEEIVLDKLAEIKCEIKEEEEEQQQQQQQQAEGTLVSKKKKSKRKEKQFEKVEIKTEEKHSETLPKKKSKQSKENLEDPSIEHDIVILEPSGVETSGVETSKKISSKKRKNDDQKKDDKDEPVASKKSKANEEEPQIVFEQVDVSGESNTIHKPPLIRTEPIPSPVVNLTSNKKLKSALNNADIDEIFKQSVTEGFKGSNLTRVRGYALAIATKAKKASKKKKKAA